MKKKENIPFSSPRWSQEMGATRTGETFELTEKDKIKIEKERKKWQKIVKELKKRRTSTK